MNLSDDVTTPEGKGKVVGFPDHENVEVRLDKGGLWNGGREQVVGSPALRKLMGQPDPDDIPRSPRTGRKLTGAALAKYQAKQMGEKS